MAKKTWVKVSGTWREVKNVWTKVNGVWKQKVVPKGNVSGSWKEFILYGLDRFYVINGNYIDAYDINTMELIYSRYASYAYYLDSDNNGTPYAVRSSSVYRYLEDGTMDTDFSFNVGSNVYSLVLGHDGSIYVGSTSGLHKFDENGNQEWLTVTDDTPREVTVNKQYVTVGSGGVSDTNHLLHIIRLDGTTRVHKTSNDYVSFVEATKDFIYQGWRKELRRIEPYKSTSNSWSVEPIGTIRSITSDENQDVYIAISANDSYVEKRSRENGDLIWQKYIDGPMGNGKPTYDYIDTGVGLDYLVYTGSTMVAKLHLDTGEIFHSEIKQTGTKVSVSKGSHGVFGV